MQDKPELKIDWASHEAAKYACENWHYSKCLPVGKLVKVGAWEDGKFIGVVLFGRGANHNMPKPYGLKQDECVELVRVALTKHKTPVSKIMMLGVKFLAKSNQGIRLIVSYADLDVGHHGGIYQATNWLYEGVFKAGTIRGFLVNGRVRHNKSIHSMGVKQSIDAVRKHIDPNAKEVFTKGKHKYLMALDNEMRAKISSLAKPYPKRVKKQDSEHPSELGGAVPTDTLHSSEVANG